MNPPLTQYCSWHIDKKLWASFSVSDMDSLYDNWRSQDMRPTGEHDGGCWSHPRRKRWTHYKSEPYLVDGVDVSGFPIESLKRHMRKIGIVYTPDLFAYMMTLRKRQSEKQNVAD